MIFWMIFNSYSERSDIVLNMIYGFFCWSFKKIKLFSFYSFWQIFPHQNLFARREANDGRIRQSPRTFKVDNPQNRESSNYGSGDPNVICIHFISILHSCCEQMNLAKSYLSVTYSLHYLFSFIWFFFFWNHSRRLFK